MSVHIVNNSMSPGRNTATEGMERPVSINSKLKMLVQHSYLLRLIKEKLNAVL